VTVHYSDSRVTLHHGDCLDVLRTLPDNSVDSVVTDPPYGLEFMGKTWDGSDGFRRSLNAADAGRDDAFGRASRTSPEYRAGSLFQEWCEAWATEALRVLKPGGHLLAFGGTRTWHRLACAVEDAGFEVRDSIAWLYGSGFPKSLDVSKAIDTAAGAEREVIGASERPRGTSTPLRSAARCDLCGLTRNGTSCQCAPDDGPATDAAREWAGWGTALKPAFEPVVVARKPLTGTVAANVQAWGAGALNIDGCRIGYLDDDPTGKRGTINGGNGGHVFAPEQDRRVVEVNPGGRWPANVVLDEDAAAVLDEQSGTLTSGNLSPNHTLRASANTSMSGPNQERSPRREFGGDSGGASRFFKVAEADERGAISPHFPRDFDPPFLYQAKAPKRERPVVDGVAHPTVKPLALMRWLVRLVTPPGGVVLEPFAGSGTTVEACLLEGFQCIAIEKGDEYLPLIVERIARQDRARIEAEVVREVDQARAIAEQVAGQLDIFGEETA
jgi:DNA modification methylase